MNNEDFSRYSRQIFIDCIGVEGQKKLLSSKVLVVGAGGLGSPVIQYLTAAGVGDLGIIDHDMVELHNLNRQIIHKTKSVGKPKVNSARNFVKDINEGIQVCTYCNKISEKNAGKLVSQYDVVVDASDNFSTRYLLNDTCVLKSKPLVYGSILEFQGQTAVFNYLGSKNLRDIFPTPPISGMDCDSKGVLGALPGIVGSLMAMNVLKILCKLPVKTNHLLLINTLEWTFDEIEF